MHGKGVVGGQHPTVLIKALQSNAYKNSSFLTPRALVTSFGRIPQKVNCEAREAPLGDSSLTRSKGALNGFYVR